MLKKETYLGRRAALLRTMKGETGVALFLGNTDAPAQCLGNCYKWRQDSTWLYLFGIDEPRLAAIIDLESGEETLFGDDCSLDDLIWNGPAPTVCKLAASTGIGRTAAYGDIADFIAGRKVHFVPASRYATALKFSELLGVNPADTMCRSKAGCPLASEPLLRAIIAQRLVKSPEEIALLDDACVTGQEMHTVARRGIRIGEIEQNIVGRMEGVALSKGWGTSFSTILTQHGEIFHCHSHECAVEPGKLMVIDAGSEGNHHYASDFTRTYPTGGRFTPRQRDIYRIVYDCHELAFSLTRPGISYMDVHLAAAEKMLDGLSALGLVRGDVREMTALGIAGMFMPHGLGHNIGLDDHDMEDYGEDLVGYGPGQKRSSQLGLGSLRMARVLESGNVISDEPGIYFIPALIEQWKRDGTDRGHVNYGKLEEYYDFGGIRIEDDVLVTDTGARRLGGERLPASPDEVEEAMLKDKEIKWDF